MWFHQRFTYSLYSSIKNILTNKITNTTKLHSTQNCSQRGINVPQLNSLLCLLRPERTSSACWSRTKPDRRLWRLTTAPSSPQNPCRPCRETICSPSATKAPRTCTRNPWPRWDQKKIQQGVSWDYWLKDSVGSQETKNNIVYPSTISSDILVKLELN